VSRTRFLRSFQSAPSRGGRLCFETDKGPVDGFQSAPSRGGRPSRQWTPPSATSVSIRALAWRATGQRLDNRLNPVGFNPRPRVEGDEHEEYRTSHYVSFNPRPRVEGDSGLWSAFRARCCFNPRPRVEGDSPQQHGITRRLLFQSAPSRGGRLRCAKFVPPSKRVSIRALAWRATA